MLLKKRVALCLLVVAMLTCSVSSRRIDVGGALGWTQDFKVNYTDWATHHQFYLGDWLYFRFDKHKYNVLEVNQTNYENCNDREFIKNITKGGRDVMELTETRPYYFLSGGGYCYNGLKLAINVSLPVPAPSPAKTKSGAAPPKTTIMQVVLLATTVATIEAFIWSNGL